MANSSRKPAKPYPSFPLTVHPNGYYSKQIRGQVHYFGRWAKREGGKLKRLPGQTWKAALEDYQRQADDLHAGRTPRQTKPGELTVADLGNLFYTAKRRQLDEGSITGRTFAEYTATMDRLVAFFGKRRLVEDVAADDFAKLRAELAKTRGPVSLSNEIGRIRVVFKLAVDEGWIEKPVRAGTALKKPSAKTLRIHRNKQPKRMFEAAEIRAALDAASPQLRAMILLAVNCGMGNEDCAQLPLRAIDLEAGWLDYPRPKTGVKRRAKLWPETVEALRAVVAERKPPKDAAYTERLFVTKYGKPWSNGGRSNPISAELRKLLQRIGAYRQGLSFYALRHTFRTIADATRDFPAILLVMGHVDDSISSHYREHIDDERLEAVAEHVRGWLFAEG